VTSPGFASKAPPRGATARRAPFFVLRGASHVSVRLTVTGHVNTESTIRPLQGPKINIALCIALSLCALLSSDLNRLVFCPEIHNLSVASEYVPPAEYFCLSLQGKTCQNEFFQHIKSQNDSFQQGKRVSYWRKTQKTGVNSSLIAPLRTQSDDFESLQTLLL
jgi:hypothetical protein